jgi:hypothetical protein
MTDTSTARHNLLNRLCARRTTSSSHERGRMQGNAVTPARHRAGQMDKAGPSTIGSVSVVQHPSPFVMLLSRLPLAVYAQLACAGGPQVAPRREHPLPRTLPRAKPSAALTRLNILEFEKWERSCVKIVQVIYCSPIRSWLHSQKQSAIRGPLDSYAQG